MVVRPKINDFWLAKTLMYKGSSINIMYYDTFQRLRLLRSLLRPTITMFKGIVLGRKAFSIGQVTLDVTFGTKVNCRKEKISFEVVNFSLPLHAWVTCIHQVHCGPLYAYNMLKMSGPKGVIVVKGDFNMAIECKVQNTLQADAIIASDELELTLDIDPNDTTILKRPMKEADSVATFEAAKETTRVDLVQGDSS